MVAALGGMVVPAVLFVVTVSALGDAEAASGWGIPMATDIAFALAVLAVMGSQAPRRAARVPAHPGRGRRPRRDPRHRDLLQPRILPAALPRSPSRAWRLWWRPPAQPRRRWWIYRPARAGRVGLHARERRPRHRRRRGARPAHAGARRPGRGESRPPTGYEHAHPPDLGRACACPLFAFFSAGVTFVGLRRLGHHHPVADRHRGRPRPRQAARRLRRRPARGAVHPGLAVLVAALGRRPRGRDPRRHRLHRVAAHQRARLRGRPERARPRPRSASSSRRSSPPLLAAVALQRRGKAYAEIAGRGGGGRRRRRRPGRLQVPGRREPVDQPVGRRAAREPIARRRGPPGRRRGGPW